MHSSVLERTESDLSKINWLRGVILLIPIVLVPWGTFYGCYPVDRYHRNCFRWAIKARGGTDTKGEKKGGERVAPELPTPLSAHHLLLLAATAILHQKPHQHCTMKRRKNKRKKRRGRKKMGRTENETRLSMIRFNPVIRPK